MNIKASYQYQLADHKKSIILYYFIIVCVYAFFIVSALFLNSDQNGTNIQLSGMGIATMVFLFVSGLCAFKETFGMLMQNGVSRKNLFIGRIVTTLTVAFVLAVIDNVFLQFLKILFKSKSDIMVFSSMYEQAYINSKINNGTLLTFVTSILFDFLFYSSFLAAGYIIAILFYRLNKSGKVAVGVGVPVGLFIVLPILDGIFTKGRISIAIGKFIDYALGLSTLQPSHAMITCIISFLLITGISWILLRRAVVKE